MTQLSVYMFQATSDTSLFTAIPTILARIVPVKLLIAFYALPCYSKKEILVSTYKFIRFHIIGPQINQLLKIFISTYDFIDFLEPTKDWLKFNGDLKNNLFWTDHLYPSKFGNKNLHRQFLHSYNNTKLYQRIQNLFMLIEVDPSCYVTADVSTVNAKHFSLCYNVTSVTCVKVCNLFISCQSLYGVDPVLVDVVHVTSDSIRKYWNEIFLCRPRILPAPFAHVANVSTHVKKSHEDDCPCGI